MEQKKYCQITVDNNGNSPFGIRDTNSPIWLGNIPYDGISGVSGSFSIRDQFPNSASASKPGWIQMRDTVYVWGYIFYAIDRHVYFQIVGESNGPQPDRGTIQPNRRQIPLEITSYGEQLYKSKKIDPARQKFLPNNL